VPDESLPVQAPAPEPEQWVLVLVARPDGSNNRRPPPWAGVALEDRVKRALKILGRSCGLRCVAMPRDLPEGTRVSEAIEE
jgi:hypothetical protein